MLCSLSGKTPSEPVVSAKSGNLFERKLIEKYIQINGKCPITDEELSLDDLVAVKSNNKIAVARPATASSIPQILQTLQTEWDATMLETFTLKKHLDTARKELSQALYQHDAACRVIARLVKERDQARDALANAQAGKSSAGAAAADDSAMTDDAGAESAIDADAIAELQATAKKLSKGRKKRQVSRNLATTAQLGSLACANAQQLHDTPPGVTCVAAHPTDDQLLVTGGHDGNALVYNRSNGKIAATLAGHTARINSVAFGGAATVLTASADRTARVWTRAKRGNSFDESIRITAHTGEVTSVVAHPSDKFAASVGRDGRWTLFALDNAEPLYVGNAGSPLLTAALHPDGLLLGAGDSRGLVSIFDISSGMRATSLDAHQGGVSTIAFSDNGYMVATGGVDDATVKLWDLRKQLCVHSLRLEAGYGVQQVAFDGSGSYLAVVGADVRVFAGRTLTHVTTLTEHAAVVTGAAWGADAKWLATSSNDRTVRFWQADQ